MRAHSSATALLSLIMVGLGIALLARTLAAGGGEVGTLLGVLFVVAGGARLYLLRRR
jgi:hypothetical protein